MPATFGMGAYDRVDGQLFRRSEYSKPLSRTIGLLRFLGAASEIFGGVVFRPQSCSNDFMPSDRVS